ncbi:RpiB/LacA/LacB family sugar-phosphate isomerase [Gorillibacterium timonense]|uniref:RpiB/LacA/LacB family sugar-phosphate isomerase n=1 Tax=Gorillibacterium timonense TaxID=1689269 RepID=UPI00071E45D7|nr:RpiB/LacA/LacB family sugar-phosphate isomerase [Gorillibacterium timonense]
MRLVLGCDHNGFVLKEQIKAYLREQGIDVRDLGCHSDQPADYPDIAFAAADLIAREEESRAILVCGTGNGMAISANKVAGVRAALCHDPISAERARKSNDAQILTMGAWIIDWQEAKLVIDIWLASEFGGGESARKVGKIIEHERNRLG